MPPVIAKGPNPDRPLFSLLYGLPKVGKSVCIAGLMDPIFLDCARETHHLDVHRIDIDSWRAFDEALGWLAHGEHAYRTVCVSTLDALERLLIEHLCTEHRCESLEDLGGGYGKGWGAAAKMIGQALTRLDLLRVAGKNRKPMNVIIEAHARVETFPDPSGVEYKRWHLRCNKAMAEVTLGRVEDVLFACQVVTTKGPKDRQARSQERVIFAQPAPGITAGNRRGFPARFPLSAAAFMAALRDAYRAAKARKSDQDVVSEPDPGDAALDAISGQAPAVDSAADAADREAEEAHAAGFPSDPQSPESEAAAPSQPSSAPPAVAPSPGVSGSAGEGVKRPARKAKAAAK